MFHIYVLDFDAHIGGYLGSSKYRQSLHRDFLSKGYENGGCLLSFFSPPPWSCPLGQFHAFEVAHIPRQAVVLIALNASAAHDNGKEISKYPCTFEGYSYVGDLFTRWQVPEGVVFPTDQLLDKEKASMDVKVSSHLDGVRAGYVYCRLIVNKDIDRFSGCAS